MWDKAGEKRMITGVLWKNMIEKEEVLLPIKEEFIYGILERERWVQGRLGQIKDWPKKSGKE